MNTINERNWQMLHDIRKEIGLDETEPVELEEVVSISYRARPPYSCNKERYSRSSYVPRKPTLDEKPQPGEIRMKDFLIEESTRSGISQNSVWARIRQGKYGVGIRRVNHKLVYVRRTGPDSILDIEPREGEIPMKQWILELATAEGVSCNCIYNRVLRGTLIAPNKRIVNGRVTFVKP